MDYPPTQAVRPAWHRRALNLVLDRALDGTVGKLTNAKWAAIGKCSVAPALCDIKDLLERGVLGRLEGRGAEYGVRVVCQIGRYRPFNMRNQLFKRWKIFTKQCSFNLKFGMFP